MHVFQILFILFALVAVSLVLKRKKEGLLSIHGVLFWVLFWVAATIVVLVPHMTSAVANMFGIGRGVDFILYIAVSALFFVFFRLHIKLERLQRDITKVVRDKALKK